MSGDADRGVIGFVAMSAYLLIVFGVFAVIAVHSASADDQMALGHALLEQNCGGCHAVGPSGDSPFAPAPQFRTLGERYPIEDLEEALAEGILSGHPAMPEFTFEPDQIGAIILYLKSVQQE